MSTDAIPATRRAKNHFVLITVRVWAWPLVILFPLRCIAEILEGLSDILCLCRRTKAGQFLATLENIHAQVRDYGPLDLVDVDVTSHEARVRVRVLTR
jgi:hypothetical protein